jgi:hypothetical protein
MDRYSYQRERTHKAALEAHATMQKAMEPYIRHCYILDVDVHILIEYPYYKNPNVKGPEGEIYCENILKCYQENVKCRWSGISPSYPDPFNPHAPRHGMDKGISGVL